MLHEIFETVGAVVSVKIVSVSVCKEIKAYRYLSCYL
jgi:hypothetical protein